VSDELVDQADPPMPEYRVIATPRDDGGYQLDFVDLGSTQTRETSRAAVEQAAREFLSLMLGLPGDRFRVKIEYRDS
jgi:hypothetical protein